MGRSNSRSHSSRSKSRSQSSSRSRSRSHSRKKRYSSRSRSRTYSRSRSRDRVYSRDYRRDYRNNRGMRRPYGYRGRGRGYYQGGGGRYHRGGYRPVWNRRHSRSPRRGRSRSRSPKRRSVSSQRSRSRSRRSYRSSRSPRSSSSRSSSPYSKSPVSKRRGSLEKQAKKTEGAPPQDSPLKSKSQDEQKDTFEHDPSESLDDFNKSSAASGDIWPGLSAYDNSPRSPHSPSIATPPSQSSSCSDAPLLSTVHSAKNTPSQHSHSIQHSPERSGSGSLGNGSSRYSPSQNSPIHHIPSRRSPAKTVPSQNVPREEARMRSSFYPDAGDQETAKTGKFLKRPASLTKDRLLASTLVHSVKKEQEFRSIFDHIKLPQANKSTSESFIQHIVSLVHHVKEQYFKSPGTTLNERFTAYQKATEEHSTRQKSPEIHRRIDISPSTLRKHTRLAGEERVFKEESQKGEKKLRCDSADLRHDIDRRRKERSKERGDSKGSRESSGSRKQEKTPKDFKEYKSYKDDSKHKSREQDRSRSSSSTSSSSASSREDKDSKKEREEEFKAHHEQKEYSGFAGVSRPRGTFFRIRGRGRARGVFAGTNTGPNNSNTTFQKRPKEEEWDPEYTPKSKKYFLHDDRDDGVDYWAKRGRGRGTFQRGRGRFNFKKSGSSPKWTHDKYQGDGIVEDEEETMENNEEKKERRKEEKVENSDLSVN
uniref:BCL2 associated transcription factor 1 n=1 Tax=Ornithorhynchus anatinus TaxID=9258 RepID=A0A6I8P8R6_ORNAN